jgi:hypothetical protein
MEGIDLLMYDKTQHRVPLWAKALDITLAGIYLSALGYVIYIHMPWL